MNEKKTRSIDLPAMDEVNTPAPKRINRAWAMLWRFTREILVLIVLMIAGVIAIKWWNTKDLLPTDGTMIQPFLMRTPDGVGMSITDFRGKVVLLHFWAPWCGVCKLEVDQLNGLYHELPPDTALVAVALDATVEQVATFVESEKVNYPVFLGDDEVGRQMQIRQFPTTYVLDRRGRIVNRDAGWSPKWNFRRMVTNVE